MSDIEKIRQAMTTLEAQRPILGDAVVDASLGALRKQLAELEAAQGAEQRKLVSLLFADLVGFTSMSDRLDPEDVHAIQQAYFSAVTAPIKEQGGMIEKYIGDAIVAVFGLPKADEDDPDRAVMAALKMHTALAELNSHLEADLGFQLERPLQMRIGINTGLAIVRMKGGNEFEMVGDSVNLASRLQSAAPAGGVLISYDTYRHVRGVFDLQALEAVTVKGKPDPIQVFLVTGAKKRSFRTRKRGVEGIETRMIGREMELMTLQQAFSSAVEDGERRAVTIVADPGMGKSRLIYEFENWVDLRPERITVLRGRARMEIQHLPYSLLRDMFSFRFGIQDDDPLPELWRKFEVGLQEFQEIKENASEAETKAAVMAVPAPSDSQLENHQMRAHFIGQLLGYDFSASPHLQAAKDDPAQIQERASAYLSEYFTSIAEIQPILMLLEDLHWGDDASLNMIGRLASRLEGRRVLVLATTRPTLYERRQHWMEGQEFHHRLDLLPLSKRDSRRLVEEVLQKVRDIPETLRDLVVTNAEGNPFYVEELVKMLIEEGVIVKGEESWQVLPGRLTEIRIPATLTGVLQARLDGLPEAERSLIQQASVVGRVFWDQALSQMNSEQTRGLPSHAIHDGLTDLRLKEMVYRRENSVFAGSEELIFKHAMLREVTYASLIKRLRRVYHRLTAEWLVEVTQASGRVDEYTGLIAEHYFQAEELLLAADWLTRAGERAHLQGALQEAGIFFDRALSLLPAAEGNRRWRALEGRGAILMIQGQDDLTLRAYLDELMSLARSLDNDSHAAEAHLRKAMYIANRGENRQAIREYQSALESARRAGNRLIEARTLASMAIIHARLGERQAAQSAAEASLEAAFQTGDINIMAKVHNNAAVACMELGDAAKAIRYLSRSMEYEQQVGDIPGMGNTLNNLGYQYLMLGIIEPALDALERARGINQGVGARRDLAYTELNLALARLRGQDAAGALASLRTSTADLVDQGDEFGRAAGLTYQGLALEASASLQEAAACFRQAQEIHVSIGFMTYAMDAKSGMARCALGLGRLEEAQTEAAALWKHLEEHGGTGLEFPVWAYLTCAQVFQAANQTDQFEQALSAGYRELMDRAEKISDADWRRSFLENVPEHRQIIALWETAGPHGAQGQLSPSVSS